MSSPANRRFRRPRSFRLWIAYVCAAKILAIVLLALQHTAAAVILFFSPSPWLIWQFLVPTSRGFGPSICHFRTDRREVWLTIDDGPDPATTPRVLDLLDRYHARATFFVIGEKVARHPELIREIVQRGHTVGNHTHTHPQGNFWNADDARTRDEILRCAAALEAAGAPPTRWFRPPVGLKSLALHRNLAALDRELVLWSARGYDTQVREPSRAVRRIQKRTTPGAIILLHESGPRNSPRLDVIAQLLEYLRADGYTCVIPSEECLIRR